MSNNQSLSLAPHSLVDAAATQGRSLSRQVVLEEDEYTALLSHIIARDFFPSLLSSDSEQEYFEALKSDEQLTPFNSSDRANRTDNRATWFAATPTGATNADTAPSGPPRKRVKYTDSLSLDAFQAKFTSEDNSSFTQILADENTNRRDKWAWAWDAQRTAAESKTKFLEQSERKLIEAAAAPGVRQRLMIDRPSAVGLITATQEDPPEAEVESPSSAIENSVPPTSLESRPIVTRYGESEEGALEPLQKKEDSRERAIDTWHFKVSIGSVIHV